MLVFKSGALLMYTLFCNGFYIVTATTSKIRNVSVFYFKPFSTPILLDHVGHTSARETEPDLAPGLVSIIMEIG